MSMLAVAMKVASDHMAVSVEQDEMGFHFVNCNCGGSSNAGPAVDDAIDWHVGHVLAEFIEQFLAGDPE